MEEAQKHMCKFCYRTFPSGRSLGGHMRSHLINTSPSDHSKMDHKLPKKKLPPLTSAKNDPRTDVLVKDFGKFGDILRENPTKMKKLSNKNEEYTLLEEKHCKECGKTFQSWKALFGHMKSHSVNRKATNSLEEESWNSSSDHQKLIMDNQSDDDAATPLCRRKRSNRSKRYTTTTTTNSSSLTIANSSPCVSEIDQQEQEEVALSLILLSMDMGNLGCLNSIVESSKTAENDIKVSHGEKVRRVEIESELGGPDVQRKRLKRVSGDEFYTEFEYKNLEIECNESEVNSPKTLIMKNGSNQFGSDYEKISKFTCVICKKAFPSYQALGGHRASHKKFKGCCAPTSESTLETQNSPHQSEDQVCITESKIGMRIKGQKNKEHECPICFKIFPSGQALGGHKRSHLTGDQSRTIHPSVTTQERIPEIRDFLDLNLPAPVEEWWIGTSHGHRHDPLLGLLSS